MSDIDVGLEALEVLGKHHRSLMQAVRHLRAIETWALGEQPVRVDDSVVLRGSFPLVPERGSGWSPYRESLVPGATGTVTSVSFNETHGYWGAYFQPDALWSRNHSGEAMLDDPSNFYINVRHMRLRRPEEPLTVPPEGAMTWAQRRETKAAH